MLLLSLQVLGLADSIWTSFVWNCATVISLFYFVWTCLNLFANAPVCLSILQTFNIWLHVSHVLCYMTYITFEYIGNVKSCMISTKYSLIPAPKQTIVWSCVLIFRATKNCRHGWVIADTFGLAIEDCYIISFVIIHSRITQSEFQHTYKEACVCTQ